MKISADLLQKKIIDARTIKEAVALIRLDEVQHPVFSKSTNPHVGWDTDKPLCNQCRQELSAENRLCPLCLEINSRIESLDVRAGVGILLCSEFSKNLLEAQIKIDDAVLSLVDPDQLLILLPHDKVPEVIFFLYQSLPSASDAVSVVFPGKGDMGFGDVLAMARYFINTAAPVSRGFLTKFFFSHSHMRAFDNEDFLPFNIIQQLFETASNIKTVFSGKDRSLIRDLLKKDKINRIYELNRFYSMCNPDQKSLLDQIQITRSEPDRINFLFSLLRYAY